VAGTLGRPFSGRDLRGGPGLVSSTVSLAPGTPVGRYVVRRKIAEGGMAEIFLAASRGPEGFEKEVVIKRVRSALASDPSFVQMFIAEARVASKLNHPNIVHIFDFDQHGDSYYLAMEYVRGKSLAEIQRRTRELGVHVRPVLAAQIALEVARGLSYAHRMTDHGRPLNLVHRDVTPHNVLISFDGSVKLTDFGIAKAGNRASTVGMLKGKFAYMSPEQARADLVDARTDIFALGITLWELLTQGRLFDGDSDVAVLRAVQERPIEPPSHLNPEVDAGLSAIVLRALERSAAARYQTAHEFERALQQYVIHHTGSPEDSDVGLFLRSLFPEELRPEQAEPDLPLQLVTPSQPGSGPRSGSRSAEGLTARGGTPSPEPPPPGADTSAYALTRTKPSGKRPPPETGITEGGFGTPSVVTRRTMDERDLEAAGLAGGTRRLVLAALGGAALVLVGGGLFFAGRGMSPAAAPQSPGPVRPNPEPQPAPAPPAPAPPSATEPARPAPGPAAAEPAVAPPTPPAAAHAGPPGFLVVEATPWGRLSVDGKPYGDIEGASRPVRLAPGTHEVRLVNRKVKIWTVTIESGKTRTLKHNFISE
jgi:serine/threonine protein kinase